MRAVLGSSLRPVGAGPPAPMAVLVQRQVAARVGGVLFGLDPVTGDRSHILVEAVAGGPESLVSGTVTAQRYLLGRRGRVVEGPAEDGGPALLPTVGSACGSPASQRGPPASSAGCRTSSGPSTPTTSCGCCRADR